MPYDERTKTCAVCAKHIGPGLLMCAAHWRAVPRPMQNEVYRTWGRVVRRKGSLDERLGHIAAYRAAREAAVAAAQRAIAPTSITS